MGGLDFLAREIREVNRQNGWDIVVQGDWDNPHRICTALALIHTEISEATEAVRHNDLDNYHEELADTLIRVLDLAGGTTERFHEIVEAKIARNRERGFRHGGKRV